jgi:hypothetical protein
MRLRGKCGRNSLLRRWLREMTFEKMDKEAFFDIFFFCYFGHFFLYDSPIRIGCIILVALFE